ncbi:hypothetical protein ScPMuIL_014927 [Solemya velum]
MSGTTPDPVDANASNDSTCSSSGGDSHDRDGVPCKLPCLGQEDRQSDTVNPPRYEDRQTDTPTTFGQEGTQTKTKSVTPSTDSTQTVARSAGDLQLMTKVDGLVEESLLKLAEGLSGAAIGNLVIGPQTIVINAEPSEKASPKQPPGISSKLQNRIKITEELMIQKLNADLYVSTRSLKACKETLNDKGCVVITGGSGDGKTTIGLKLLFQSNRHLNVVLRDPKDWKEIDISLNCLIFIDDVFGRFVLDSDFKRKWLAQFEEMYTCVQGGKLQVIITCRASIIEGCKNELAKYRFFEKENICNLRGEELKLTYEEKRKMIEEYIRKKIENETSTGSRDDVAAQTDMTGLDSETLDKIARTDTWLGFPLCCQHFISESNCFARGATFFEKPREFICDEIDQMSESSELQMKFQYCVLVAVLVLGVLTEDDIDEQGSILKDLASACRISNTEPLASNVRKAAEHLTASYLNCSQEEYSFKHNSILEAVFFSFFKCDAKLLIQHCNFDLILSFISSNNCCNDPELFCVLPPRCEKNMFARMISEVLQHGSLAKVFSHRVLTDSQFCDKFLKYLSLSDAKQKFFEIREWHWLLKDVSVLGWATQESEKGFTEKLMLLMKAEISASTMTQELSKALVIACGNSKSDIYKLLVSIRSNQVSADCFLMAVRSSNLEIVNDLLRRKSWDIKEVSEALCQACMRCEYGIYKSLVSHLPGVVVPSECLSAAVRSGNKLIVEELLKIQKWDKKDILVAMREACTFDEHFILEYVSNETGIEVTLECMCSAIKKNHAQLVGRLLSMKKWTGEDISRAFHECCLNGNHDIYDLLFKRYGLHEVGSDCLCLSVSGGSIAIVKALLDTVVWSDAEKFRALCEAYQSAQFEICEVFKHKFDAAVLPMDCLLAAARSGNREMFEAVQKMKTWDESEFSEALFELCRCGKYDNDELKELFSQFPLTPTDVLGVARSGNRDMLLWALNQTCQLEPDDISEVLYSCGRYSDEDIIEITNCIDLTPTKCLTAAVRGGNIEIVQKILNQKSWEEQLIVEALTNACRFGHYNIFTVLKLHADSHLESTLECLIIAVRGGNKEIVKDLLTMESWTDDDLTGALCESCKFGDLLIFNLLVQKVTVTWNCLCTAARSGSTEIVRELLKMKQWDNNDIMVARCEAMKYNYPKTAELLKASLS